MCKAVCGITLALLLSNILSSALIIHPVMSEWTGTVYIRANGSIDPPDAPIVTYDYVTYTLTGNITSTADGIVVERDNIIIDGNGFTIQGSNKSEGVYISGRYNVTIKNTNIKNFHHGIMLGYCSNVNIIGNNITTNRLCGLWLLDSSNNSIIGNNIVANEYYGVRISHSSNNNIIANMFIDDGLFVDFSFDNVVVGNTVNGKPLVYLENLSNHTVTDAGQVILVRCSNIRVEGLNLSRTSAGIELQETTNTTINRNTITNNLYGVLLVYSSNNTISENIITNNKWVGIEIVFSSFNTLNNNTIMKNFWGIELSMSSNNNLSYNNLTGNYIYGVSFFSSYNNKLRSNSIVSMHQKYACNFRIVLGGPNDVDTSNIADGKPIYYLVNVQNQSIPLDAAFVALINCTNINVENLHLKNNSPAILLVYTTGSKIFNNTITDCEYGIRLDHSDNNTIWGNNVTANFNVGICIEHSCKNRIYHNNFNNFLQVRSFNSTNIWDNGYPSGGNYWSDYVGDDANGDGIGDTSYTIDANNTDRYPLMAPFKAFEAGIWNGMAYNVDVVSNSTVSDFKFNVDYKSISFNVTGDEGTMGFCRVTIPKSLLWVDDDGWTIFIDGQPLTDYSRFEDENFTYLYFTYNHSTKTVTIKGAHVVPENPSTIILTIFMLTTTILMVLTREKKLKHR